MSNVGRTFWIQEKSVSGARDTSPLPDSPPQEKESRRKFVSRGVRVLAIVVVGVGGVWAANEAAKDINNNVLSGSVYDKESESEPIPYPYMRIDANARFRSSPLLPFSRDGNLLMSAELGDATSIIIPTPGGVYVAEDRNGLWYGMRREEVEAIVDTNNACEVDRDGIVWVNEQKAQPFDNPEDMDESR